MIDGMGGLPKSGKERKSGAIRKRRQVSWSGQGLKWKEKNNLGCAAQMRGEKKGGGG